MTDSSRITLYTCYTLIDISKTNVTRSEKVDTRERNQQRNYETLLQVISLRAQPVILESPEKLLNQDLVNYKFGGDFTGAHTVWRLVFGAEHVDIYKSLDDPTGLLSEDLNHSPIISGLDESVNLSLSIFSTNKDSKNTYFTIE